MPDILVVKCNAFLPHEKMQAVLDNLRAQKETGVILLPPFRHALIQQIYTIGCLLKEPK